MGMLVPDGGNADHQLLLCGCEHMCSHRLLGVQPHSYLNQCEDLLSLLSIRLGSWTKNSLLSTHNIAEPSLSSSPKWQNSYSWGLGISLLLSLALKNFLGLRTLFYQVMGFAGSWQKSVFSVGVLWAGKLQLATLKSFVQSFRFYLLLKYNFSVSPTCLGLQRTSVSPPVCIKEGFHYSGISFHYHENKTQTKINQHHWCSKKEGVV